MQSKLKKIAMLAARNAAITTYNSIMKMAEPGDENTQALDLIKNQCMKLWYWYTQTPNSPSEPGKVVINANDVADCVKEIGALKAKYTNFWPVLRQNLLDSILPKFCKTHYNIILRAL